MSLIEYDLMGNVRNKVERAIEIARSFCPPEGYYLAYSGGKDSTVVKAVLDMAGVKYDAHYNVTTVDPPELVRFIISQFDYYNIPYCTLYDEGFKRIGCIGCPMGRGERMKRDFQRWPQVRKMYERAFDEMLAERNKRGLVTQIGNNGREILEWWLGLFDTNRKNTLDQIGIDELIDL